MASTAPQLLLMARDYQVLAALDRCPLTAAQVLKLSQTFVTPFTSERRVRERLQVLRQHGCIRCFPYATTGPGSLRCYTLSPLGYRVLHGPNVPLPAKRSFAAVSLARQTHTFALAEFLVHTTVAAVQISANLAEFRRENTVQLNLGEDSLYPDATFQLHLPPKVERRFFLEIDNSSERIRSEKSLDSWERKIRFYDRFQDSSTERFRVLVVTTQSAERLQHILNAAGELTRNPQRSLFYGIYLPEFLAQVAALTQPCFRDHRGNLVSLVPDVPRRLMQPSPALPVTLVTTRAFC